MFEKFKEILSRAMARRKIDQYDRKYRASLPMAERPEPIAIESTFDVFVQEFGGKKISDLIEDKSHMPLNADYLFKDHNVIAELKTLEGIYSGPEAIKQLSQAYIDSGCTGSDIMGLLWRGEKVPEATAALMRKRILRSIEQRVKESRKQLKNSKIIFGNDQTKCLILFAMNQRPLFGHKTMLFNMAKIMGDNYSDIHTDGVIYFNPNTPTRIHDDGMEFSGWYPFYRDEDVNKELSSFVNLLGNRWLNFYRSEVGGTNPILELDSFEAASVLLD